jgi:trimeric autotransporter adhesin
MKMNAPALSTKPGVTNDNPARDAMGTGASLEVTHLLNGRLDPWRNRLRRLSRPYRSEPGPMTPGWLRITWTVILIAFFVPFATAQLTPVWEYSLSNDKKPAWLADGLQRGIAFGEVDGRHLLFVASGESGGLIRFLDSSTGAEIGTLDTTGISGGWFAINDVEVSEDNIIFACNMTINAQEEAFKVYRWDGIDSEPRLVIQFQPDTLRSRLGDKFTVHGAASDNSLAIYAASPTSLPDFFEAFGGQDSARSPSLRTQVIRFTTSDHGESFVADTLNIEELFTQSAPSVAPVAPEGSFYLNAIRSPVVLVSGNGSVLGSLDERVIEHSWRNNALQYIMAGEKRYLALYDYEIPGVRIVDVSEGTESARKVAISPSLSLPGIMPHFGQGDVTYGAMPDGSIKIFVLATDVGIAAYTMTP